MLLFGRAGAPTELNQQERTHDDAIWWARIRKKSGIRFVVSTLVYILYVFPRANTLK